MLDIGWTELLLIAVVAIVVIGPKDLPRVMRLVGQWTAKARNMGRDFQRQFNEALREAELEDVKKDVEALAKSDPMADLRNEMTRTGDEIRKGLDSKPEAQPVSAPPAPAAEEATAPAAPVAPPTAAAGDANP